LVWAAGLGLTQRLAWNPGQSDNKALDAIDSTRGREEEFCQLMERLAIELQHSI